MDRVEAWDMADTNESTYCIVLRFGDGSVCSFGCLVLVIVGLVGHEGGVANKRSASAFVSLVMYYQA